MPTLLPANFDEYVLQWQPFFTTVAAVSATLVGLLFVSLSLNRDKLAANSSGALLRVARRTFSDFLLVLLIALFFLIPNQGRHPLSLELIMLALFRLKWLATQIISAFRGDEKFTPRDLIHEYSLPLLSILGLAAAGVGIYQGNILAVYYFIVPVIASLLFRASRNAWLLLIMEGQ